MAISTINQAGLNAPLTLTSPVLTTPTISTGAILNSSGRPMVNQTGCILQIVQAVKTDTFTTTSASYVDVTGLSVTITPSSTSSKILVTYSLQFSGITDSYGAATFVRNGSIVVAGTSATGNQTNVTTALATGSSGNWDYKLQTSQFEYLDSPATTSALTYKVQVKVTYSSRQVNINGPYSTDNYAYSNFGVSTITVKEIAG